VRKISAPQKPIPYRYVDRKWEKRLLVGTVAHGWFERSANDFK